MSQAELKVRQAVLTQQYMFTRDYWSGDSRDGHLVNGEGYHYYRMSAEGLICEAYELYETDDGQEVVCPLPEMNNVDWFKDLGFSDMEILDPIAAEEFERIRDLLFQT